MTRLPWASLALIALCCPLGRAQEPRANLFKRPDAGHISVLAFAPDGKALAVGAKDGSIRLLHVPQGNENFVLEHEIGSVTALAFSKDGVRLVAGHADGQIALWNVPQRRLLKTWKAHAESVGAVLWHADDSRILSGGFDSAIRLWRDAKEEQAWTIPSGRVTSLALSADGKKLVSGGIAAETYKVGSVTIRTTASAVVRLWDLASGKAEATALRGMNVVISPDGRLIAAAGMVSVPRTKAGFTLDGRDRVSVSAAGKDKPHEHDGIGHLLAMSRDGKHLVSGGQNLDAWFGGIIAYTGVERRDHRLRLWDLMTGKELLCLPQADARVIALAPDARYLAAADEQHVLKIWDIEKEKRDPTPTPKDLALAPAAPAAPGRRPRAPAVPAAPAKQPRPRDPELEKLLAGLDRDYQELLKEERQSAALREAAQDFLRTGPGDYWAYKRALEKLRKHPSPAAVPLILTHLLDRPDDRPGWYGDDFINALVILTGEDLQRHFTRGSRGDALVTDWWSSLKNKVMVEPAKMGQEQNERRLTMLLGLAAKNDRSSSASQDLAYDASTRLRALLSPYASDRPAWFDNEIHPSMTSLLLARCGAGGAEPGDGPDDRSINLHAVAMLARLHKRGEAPELAKLGKDRKQPAAVRLGCLLATRAAGDDLSASDILEFYKEASNLELRVLALLTLPATAKPGEAAAQLVEALDHGNVHIRSAAVHALGKIPVPAALAPAALAKLTHLAEQPAFQDSWLSYRTLLDAIVHLGSPEAKKFLATHLEARLNKNDDRSISHALRAFETITGKRWTEPGAHDNQYYRERAAQAVAWWKKQ